MVAHAADGVPAQPEACAVINEDKAKPEEQVRTKLPTVDEFRRAIPAHCFERSLVRSLRYLVQDYAILISLYLAVPYFEHYAGLAGLFVWYCLMGVFGFALFVVGHDCLHGSFSEHQWLNDVLGHIAFAPILSPYFPWQKSHKLHHAFTNHLEKDKGHPWNQEKHWVTWPAWMKYFNAFPLSGWIKWMPVYTIFGYSDGSHFWPWSRLFQRNEERVKCVVSGILCAICAYIAFVVCGRDAFVFFKYYIVPLSFFGLMLVIVTYLQHTDAHAEIYEADEWSFVRGQTQTIDRTYGFGLDIAMHNITDAHVVHHFFNKIPHYHLVEATAGIKQVLEPYRGTQYGYKYEVNYNFFALFLKYNVHLDYLVYKCKGIMQYRAGKEETVLLKEQQQQTKEKAQ